MPKIIDHEARRADLVQAAWRVIERVGLEGATIRAIAGEAGASTAIVTHYFADKREILRAVLSTSQARIEERRRAAVSRHAGIEALEVALLDSLPLDEERRLELLIEVSFWARAITDPDSAAEHLRSHDAWRRALVRLLKDCVARGEVPPCNVNEEADILVALIDGLGVDALMHPERLSSSRQVRLVRAALQRIGRSETTGSA